MANGRLSRGAGQQVRRHLREDSACPLGIEAGDEREFAGWATDLVPRQPHTVRVPQFGLAMVLGKVFGEEYELSRGTTAFVTACLLVVGIDGESALDFDRLFRAFAVEHQPSADPAYAGLVGLVHDRIGPHGNHPIRNLRAFSVERRPCDRLQERVGAARERDQQTRHGEPIPNAAAGDSA